MTRKTEAIRKRRDSLAVVSLFPSRSGVTRQIGDANILKRRYAPKRSNSILQLLTMTAKSICRRMFPTNEKVKIDSKFTAIMHQN